jgi:alkanesulfonate monooxygenase SsuD/methylene tetrahydromethanopterin reductase-like flavin-dependent oxidoreductase (luciferase family)
MKYPYDSDEAVRIEAMRNKMIIGDPKEVKQQLTELQSLYKADEIMIVTITNRYEDRQKSYQLIANEVW